MIRWLPLLLLAAAPAAAQPIDDLERDDSLMLSVAWQLETANARYCPHTAPATGIQLEDAAVYSDPAFARQSYGLTGDISIGALAETGPGQAAGLAVNQTVTAIDGHPLTALPQPPANDRFARLRQAQAMLDTGAVTLTLGDGHTVHVTPVPACHVSVQIDDEKTYATATRDEIHIGRRHFDLAQGDRAVIAALIAHELAHAMLGHETLLETRPRTLDLIRSTEREADRLSVWLLANAGYPPEAALTFQRTVIARTVGPLGLDPEHGSWRERSRIISAEIAVLKAAPDADWPHRFVRDTNR